MKTEKHRLAVSFHAVDDAICDFLWHAGCFIGGRVNPIAASEFQIGETAADVPGKIHSDGICASVVHGVYQRKIRAALRRAFYNFELPLNPGSVPFTTVHPDICP